MLLVVVLDEGARGYVIGNYAASGVVLVGLWFTAVRDHIGLPREAAPLGPLLRYGGPTVPADAAVFVLNASTAPTCCARERRPRPACTRSP